MLLFDTGLLAALSSKHKLQNEFERYSKKDTAIGLAQYLQQNCFISLVQR